MTMGKEDARESLKFKLLGNPHELGEWGHEFVRSKKKGKVFQKAN